MDDDRGAALAHMRAALALLDTAGERLAAAQLQHAIDTLEGALPGAPTDEQLARFEAMWRDSDPSPDTRPNG